MNTNFTTLRDVLVTYALLTDTARTIAVTHTYTASQAFTGGWTAAAACSITSGGLTVTGTITATSLAGTITTAAQTNITSVGTLATATITTLTTTTIASSATGKLVSGSTSFAWRNNADTLDVVKYTTTGAVLDLLGTTVNVGTAASSTVNIGTTTTGTTNINATTLALVVSAGGAINIGVAGTSDVTISTAIATTATAGFLLLPTCAGTPTGAAASTASIFDSTNKKHYVRIAGTWYGSAAYT